MLQTLRRGLLAKRIRAGFALTFFGLLALYQLPSKAQEERSHLSLQEQSVQRDQAYVQQLLKRGSSDAKVEGILKLTSQFKTFNPSGDFHAYTLDLVAKGKRSLKQAKQTQPGNAIQAAPTSNVLSSSSVVSSGSVAAPSNPVGTSSIRIAQQNNQDSTQDSNPTSTVDNNSASISSPPPTVFGGGLLVPTTTVPPGAISSSSNTSPSVRQVSGSATSNPNLPVASGTSTNQSASSASSSGSGNSNTFNFDQGPGPGPIGPGPGCNLFPAPPSVGAAVPLTYFGPSPSETNPSLVGPVQLLKSGTVDAAHGTIALPLYLGHMKGSNKNVWYILTDVDDPNVAAELGLNFSAKLTFASDAARTATLAADGTLVFDKGTVDFSPERSIVPGPPGAEFPPVSAQPGAVGDKDYSPFVQVVNAGGVIYNASIVAFGVDAGQINFPNGNVDYTKVHDEVVAIDPFNQTVTINLINGFSFGRPVWYISMDTSIPLGAAIEHNTFAPLMQNLHLGGDDSFSSPIERIFISTNGAESGACNNPQRQGLSADLADGHRPNNVLGGIPTIALDYSPAWDSQLFEWTKDAIDNGFRGQVREEFQILTFVQDGLITGPGGKPFGSSGFSINCPIAQRLD